MAEFVWVAKYRDHSFKSAKGASVTVFNEYPFELFFCITLDFLEG